MKPGVFNPDIFAENAVFHYFNPNLKELEGDYCGRDSIQKFFDKLGEMSNGTFHVEPISAEPKGDELVVIHTKNTLTLSLDEIQAESTITTNVVLVWRIIGNKVVEVWDIPSCSSAGATASRP